MWRVLLYDNCSNCDICTIIDPFFNNCNTCNNLTIVKIITIVIIVSCNNCNNCHNYNNCNNVTIVTILLKTIVTIVSLTCVSSQVAPSQMENSGKGSRHHSISWRMVVYWTMFWSLDGVLILCKVFGENFWKAATTPYLGGWLFRWRLPILNWRRTTFKAATTPYLGQMVYWR